MSQVVRRRSSRALSQKDQKLKTIRENIDELRFAGTGGVSAEQAAALADSGGRLLPGLLRFAEMNGRMLIEALRMPSDLAPEAAAALVATWEFPDIMNIRPDSKNKARGALLRYYLAIEDVRRDLAE